MHTCQEDELGTASDRIRVPNRWGEGGRLREEILEAAQRLLRRGGHPEEISLRAIAREAGITAPSVYKHFKDKAALMWAVLDGVYLELAETMRGAARSAPDGDSWAALRAVVDAYCRFALEHRQRYQLMFHIGPTLPDQRRFEQHPVRHVVEVWREVVQAYLTGSAAAHPARPDGGAPTGEQVMYLLWSSLHGQFGLWWSVSHGEPEQLVIDLRDALLLSLFGRR